MTNSYNSPRPVRIVFFHGLNNNPQCFEPIMSHFRNLGYETELIVLPGHGENRKEARDSKQALRVFDQSMKRLKNVPYYAIAFSHGALYLQIWLEKNQEHKPLKQVLLAPALFINRQKLVEKMLDVLPSFFVIKSMAPKPFRRYQTLSAWEYNVLLRGMMTYQKIQGAFKVPTMIMIDPKDELVDARTLKEEVEKKNEVKVILHERRYLKKGLGCHHIMFHPDYFSFNDWTFIMSSIERFFQNQELRDHS